MGSDPMTLVAISMHRHDRSIGLGIYDSNTAWRPDWNEAALRHAGSTSNVVFVEERSLRVLAIQLQIVGVNITCQTCGKMYGPMRWSPMIPHHTFTVKRCWQLLSTVPCGLLRSKEWEFLVLLTPSRVKWAATIQLFQNQQPLQIGPMCTYTVLHFWLRIISGIKPLSIDLKSESLANITHRRNVSVSYPAHSAPWTCGHVKPVAFVAFD